MTWDRPPSDWIYITVAGLILLGLIVWLFVEMA